MCATSVSKLHSSSAAEVPVYVNIGGATKSELLLRLEEEGVRLNELARRLFDDTRFTTAPSVRPVEVICSTVADLGLPGGGAYAQVLHRAQLQGLTVCPLELAPHLRLQWTRQSEFPTAGKSLKHRAPQGSVTVATTAPPDDQDIPWGFYLRRFEGELWLRGYRSWSGHVWDCNDRFVFMHATNAV